MNGKLYFTADNGFTGYELFVYDGTNTPYLVQDVLLGAASSAPDDYASLNGILYFRARDNAFGYELYQYDPVTTMATRLTDLCAGPDSSLRGGIITFNNKIVFAADSGIGNTELFQFDPVSGNTTLIADIYPGTQPSAPKHFTIINNKLYFSANDGNYGRELFVYDGTNAPQRITDIAGGNTSAIASINEPMIAPYAGKIYVAAKDTSTGNFNLYSVDASNNSTLAATVNGTNNSQPSWLTPFAGRLYFVAFNDTTGFEIWKLDSSNNISLAFELCKGNTGSDPEQLMVIGNDLFFRANDCLGIGTELFKYDYKSVGINNTISNNTISVYPNPAEDIATIKLTLPAADELHIQITDITGRVMMDHVQHYSSGEQKIDISVSSWAPGTYIYHINTSESYIWLNGKLAVK